MRHVLSLRRITASAVAVACAAGGLVAATAGAAGAAASGSVPSVSAAYTDAATPSTPHVDDPLGQPVGLWLDSANHYHLSRAYYTFDLSAYAGVTVSRAAVRAPNFFVAHCTKR